jgi:transcriptional regulator with XRE-family HTH domain
MSLLLREAIGGTIRRARTERGRTLRDVSREARVSLGYLSEIERGRKEPSSELLAAVCAALDLPLPELLDEVADTMRPVRRRVPAGVGAGPVDDREIDPALRTAVEEAFEPTSSSADGSETASASATASATASSSAPPAPPEPTDPAPPRTVALPEPEGEPEVTPVEGGTTVRLVGLAGGGAVASATSAGRSVPVVRVAA